ncbi:MAG: UDP-2,3-diacylglucosamine diphosphatase [Rikenellaceae bacterium]|nr:UDP-2,3-diacylglucosamine diphosphatase [Rikenellaceae bacterium]
MHYFVADIHLGSGDTAEQRRIERNFLDFLKQIEGDAETLFLVGDIFDFWFEYNEVVPKGFVRVLGRLAELHDKGVRVVMLTGNHDMWVGDYLTKECGIELYTKPQVFEVAGKRLFVAHGDNMNIDNLPMLRLMNWVFRSRFLRKAASWLIHPDLFLRFGKWWSGKSRKSHGSEQRPEVIEPLVEYVAQHHDAVEADYYIFGHMHYAADIASPHRILFMGNWHSQPNYISLDDNGEIKLKFIKS